MYLTASNLVFHLISRGIITSTSVVKGDFVLVEVGRRNRNFKIIRNLQPSFFVKQIKTSDMSATSTLQREANFYKTLSQNPLVAPLKKLVPEFVDYDPTRYALVINLLSNAESIAEYQRRTGDLGTSLAADLGRTLGACHSQLINVMNDPAAFSPLLQGEVPWIMQMENTGHTVLNMLGGIGPQLAKAIQQYPNLQPMLSALRPGWQYDSLIHGDPKLENWMVLGNGNGKVDLKLIDWELVDIGDGAWDVAMMFKEWLVLWLLSQPDTSNQVPHEFAPATTRALTDVQPAIRTFWESYVSTRQLPRHTAAAYLHRCTRYTAARLIVAVVEYFFPLPQLNSHAMSMLMLSATMLQNPEKATAELLGFAPQ